MPTLDDYITDVLMRDLVGHDRKPAAFLVYVWLAAEQARRKGDVQISYEDMAESIGISRSTAYEHWAYARARLRLELQSGQE